MALQHSPSIVTNGLVLCMDAANPRSYPGTGTVWNDASGNTNNGTLINGVGYNSANLGTLVFDGVDDTVSLGYAESLISVDITHIAWVNATVFASWNGIISTMPSWGTGFSLQIGTTQRIAAMISGIYLTTSWAPLTDTWYCIAATHRALDDLCVLYVNGVQENSTTRAITYTANAVTTIGCFYTSPSLLFNGKISDVMTYNRALTAQEIQQNFNALRGRYGI